MSKLDERVIGKPVARLIAEELILDFGTVVDLLTVKQRSAQYGVDWERVVEAYESAKVTVSWDD